MCAHYLGPPCSLLQAKVVELLKKQAESGKTISESLREHRGYRNPDFLEHCVQHFGIDDIGSAFPSEVFDPHGLPPEDYYDRSGRRM